MLLQNPYLYIFLDGILSNVILPKYFESGASELYLYMQSVFLQFFKIHEYVVKVNLCTIISKENKLNN